MMAAFMNFSIYTCAVCICCNIMIVNVFAKSVHEQELSSLHISKRATCSGNLVNGLPQFFRLLKNGPMDLVVLMDRSAGIGRDHFYLRMKKLTADLIRYQTYLYRDYVRLSVLTFASDVRTVIDGIHGTSVTKCQLFGWDRLWDKVEYHKERELARETKIDWAMSNASEILDFGRLYRPGVRQAVLILTDGGYRENSDPKEAKNSLINEHCVSIFAAGVGAWVTDHFAQVRYLVSSQDNYGSEEEWMDAIRTQQTVFDVLQADVVPSDDCTCGSGGTCQCDAVSGQHECECEAGYYLDRNTCAACPAGTYKPTAGNLACTPCPHETSSPEGATSKSQCICQDLICKDPCAAFPCRGIHEVCSKNGQVYSCTCAPGWQGPGCIDVADTCAEDTCERGGTCVTGPSGVNCLCPWGFSGRRCEINDNECEPGVCDNNAKCEDRDNDYFCVCPPPFCPLSRYCDTTSCPYLSTTPASDKLDSTEDEGGFMKYILYYAVPAVGVILIVVIATTLGICIMRRKRKRAQGQGRSIDTNDSTDSDRAADTTPMNTYALSPVRDQDNDIQRPSYNSAQSNNGFASVINSLNINNPARNNHFQSGVAKKPPKPPVKPMKPVKRINNDNANIRIPTAPSLRPDVLPRLDRNEDYVNVPMTQGMREWQDYVADVIATGDCVLRMCVTRIDGTTWISTERSFLPNAQETAVLLETLQSKRIGSDVTVKGRTYTIKENSGVILQARGSGRSGREEILYLGKTRQYLIVATAKTDDVRDCCVEVEWMREHIKNQGL